MMKSDKLRTDFVYIYWSIALLLFLGFMAERYCSMIYGGGVFYMLAGKSEITQGEKEYLKERGSLQYGESLDSFPTQVYDPLLQDKGGFAIDLMDQLALEMGTSITFSPQLWPEIFESLENREVDIIQITYSKEREERYYLTAPLYRSKGVVFLRNEGKTVQKLEELEGKKLAGIKEDYGLSVLKKKVSGLQIQEYSSLTECAEALKKHEVAGIVADEQNVMYYAQAEKMFRDYYIVAEEVYEEDVVFAVRKSDYKMGNILNKAVYKLRRQDTLDKLQQKWFLNSILAEVISERQIDLWRNELVMGALAFFIFLLFHIYHGTRRMVIYRTKELNSERRRLESVLDSVPHYLLEAAPDGRIWMMNQQARSDRAIPFYNRSDQIIQEEKLLNIIKEAQKIHYVQREIPIGEQWFRVTCNCIHEETEDGNYIMMIEDITLYRLRERQEMQNSKMAAIGQLASGISHELKNPLEIICNYCYALKRGIIKSQEDIRHMAEVIEEEAKDANKIVESLLCVARTASSEVGKTELKSCIQAILEVQMPLIRKRNIEIELDCPENLYVKCNPEGMKRIIINLLMNAEEAMEPAGGKISIVASEKEQIELEFSDTGKGMSERQAEQIFNPFYTTKSSGTGLGLYLVYQQIQENNGTVRVFSKEGEGTTFRLTFPLCE